MLGPIISRQSFSLHIPHDAAAMVLQHQFAADSDWTSYILPMTWSPETVDNLVLGTVNASYKAQTDAVGLVAAVDQRSAGRTRGGIHPRQSRTPHPRQGAVLESGKPKFSQVISASQIKKRPVPLLGIGKSGRAALHAGEGETLAVLRSGHCSHVRRLNFTRRFRGRGPENTSR